MEIKPLFYSETCKSTCDRGLVQRAKRRFLRRGRRDPLPASPRAVDSTGEEGGGLQNCFAAISPRQLSEEADGENCVDGDLFLKLIRARK